MGRVIKTSFFIIGAVFILYNTVPYTVSRLVLSNNVRDKAGSSRDLRTGEILPHGKSIIRYSADNEVNLLFIHDALEPDYPGYYSNWFDALYESGINIIAPSHGPYTHLETYENRHFATRNPYEWMEALCNLTEGNTVVAAAGSGVYPALAAVEHLGKKVSSLVLISPVLKETTIRDDSKFIEAIIKNRSFFRHITPYLPRHVFQVQSLTPFNIMDSLSELEFWTGQAKANTPEFWDLDYLDFLSDSASGLDPHYWLDINAGYDITLFYSQMDRYTAPADYEKWADSLKPFNEKVIIRAMEGTGFTQLHDKHKQMVKNLIEEKLSASIVNF